MSFPHSGNLQIREYLSQGYLRRINSLPVFLQKPNILGTHSFKVVLLDKICKLVCLHYKVDGAGTNDLVSYSASKVSHKSSIFSSCKIYLAWSWKLSILALHLKIQVLQYDSSNAFSMAAESFSLRSIKSLALMPMTARP